MVAGDVWVDSSIGPVPHDSCVVDRPDTGGVCSVVSYSPAPWRVQYHRRCQA